MEIKPHIGFGKVKFGQSEKEVTAILGKPSLREKNTAEDEPEDITLEYDEQGIDLLFSADDDYRLGSVTFYGREFSLNGVSFIGSKESELKAKAKKAGISDLELDDEFDEENPKNYVSESKGILFWIQDDILDAISILPAYADNGDDVIWPL